MALPRNVCVCVWEGEGQDQLLLYFMDAEKIFEKVFDRIEWNVMRKELE